MIVLPDNYCPSCGGYFYDDHPFVTVDDFWVEGESTRFCGTCGTRENEQRKAS